MKADSGRFARGPFLTRRLCFYLGVAALVGSVCTSTFIRWPDHQAYVIGQTLIVLLAVGITLIGASPSGERAAADYGVTAETNVMDRSGIAFWEQDWTGVARHRSARLSIDEVVQAHGVEAIDDLIGGISVLASNPAALSVQAGPSSNRQDALLLPPFDDGIARAALRAFLMGKVKYETEARLSTRSGRTMVAAVIFWFPEPSERRMVVVVSATDVSFLRLREGGGTAARMLEIGQDHESLALLSTAIVNQLGERITAIDMGGEAALRWLRDGERGVGEATAVMGRVLAASRQSATLLRNARAVLKPSRTSLEIIDLAPLLAQAVDLLQSPLTTSNVRPRIVVEDDLPEITADRSVLLRTVVRLLMNFLLDPEAGRRERLLSIGARRSDENEVLVSMECGASSDEAERTGRPLCAVEDDLIRARRLVACREGIEDLGGELRFAGSSAFEYLISFTLPANADPEVFSGRRFAS